MTSEEEEINKELHELWLEDYENWKQIKREHRKKSVKRFWTLFGRYTIVLAVGIYIGISINLHISLLVITFYVLTAVLGAILFTFIFHYTDKQLLPENPLSPVKYIWENGELKVENPEENKAPVDTSKISHLSGNSCSPQS
jgi:hypothetical protein